jgi:hypothetical protein
MARLVEKPFDKTFTTPECRGGFPGRRFVCLYNIFRIPGYFQATAASFMDSFDRDRLDRDSGIMSRWDSIIRSYLHRTPEQ